MKMTKWKLKQSQSQVLAKGVRTINKNTKITILYFLVLIIAIGALKTVINESKTEIETLKVEIGQLENERLQLQNRKEFLEDILLRNKQEKEMLILQVEDLEEENEQLRTIRAKLTAYSPLDNKDGQQAEGDPNKTSTGKKVSRGYAAADPRKLPYGTKLYIPEYGKVEIQDTGAALRNDDENIRIDLFHETYPDAMRFGVKDMEVKILEWGGD
jgi:3D (Asp-Asp-Asp) domain-containing protein